MTTRASANVPTENETSAAGMLPVDLPSPALIGAWAAINPPAAAVSSTATPLSTGFVARSRDLRAGHVLAAEAGLNLPALISVTPEAYPGRFRVTLPMPPPPAEHFAARIFMGPALRAQPDRSLVNLVRDGYDAAFEEIVRRYRRPLDRFAAAIVGGRSEDVTQDAFSKALPALRGSEAVIELRPWLYRIVRNTALNDLRDRGPVPEALAETLPGGRSTAAEVEAREEIRDLMDRLQAL